MRGGGPWLRCPIADAVLKAGITPHEAKGFDVRRDADHVLDWAEHWVRQVK